MVPPLLMMMGPVPMLLFPSNRIKPLKTDVPLKVLTDSAVALSQ